MQRRLTVRAAVLAAAALLAACSGQSPAAPNAFGLDSLADGSSQAAQAAERSTTPMRTFPAGVELAGTSSLVRTDQGVSMTVRATGLTPGHAHTIWFVAFNDPGACTDGICDVQDVLANRGVPAVRFGAGHVIGDSGQANFAGHLAAGNTGGPPCAAGPALGSCGPGLLDARTAVVHLVIRTHGAAIPELVNDQISSFNGGCPPNACANVQFAEHRP
jgi:hypothetical protein